MHLSISMIFSTEDDTNSGDVMRFSTAKTTPYLRAMSGTRIVRTTMLISDDYSKI